MDTLVKMDDVLDAIWNAQFELSEVLDTQMNGTTTYRLLWEEYKRLSGLYDDVRRLGTVDVLSEDDDDRGYL